LICNVVVLAGDSSFYIALFSMTRKHEEGENVLVESNLEQSCGTPISGMSKRIEGPVTSFLIDAYRVKPTVDWSSRFIE
jgi:hypothetical protein